MMVGVLRDRRLRVLFIGLTLSLFGDSALLVVLGVAAKDLSGSYAAGGLAYVGVVLPGVLSPVAGAAIDRLPRRTFLIWACLISAVVILPLLAADSAGRVWIIYVTSLLYGASLYVIEATLSGLFKVMVEPERLAEVNGLITTVRQGFRIAGPVVGVIIYHFGGLASVTLLDAASYVAAAVAAMIIKVREPRPRHEPFRLAGFLAGARHLVADRPLRLAVGGAAASFLFVGFGSTTIYAVVNQGLGRGTAFVGVLRSAQGVGAVLGGITSSAAIKRLGELRVMGIGYLAFAAGQLGLLTGSIPVALAAMGIGYLGLIWTFVACDTFVQRRTPATLIGRTATASSAFIALPQALSIAAGAFLIQYAGYRLLQVVMVTAVTAAGLFLAGQRAALVPSPAQPVPSTAGRARR
ncbi:MAG TPA: MFS transporter [Streptosporangiaceae bacterium]|nr:MFS transporter [Streptosporangiaceae bacterium]